MSRTLFKTLISIFLFLSPEAFAQSFSCPIGKQAACLDYNDQVCGFMGKCVDSSAKCFNSYTCPSGFVCQSDYSDLAYKYDSLVDDYNDMVNNCNSKYKNLYSKYEDIVYEYESLGSKYKNLYSEYEDILDEFNSLQSCLSYASSLSEAKDCNY